MKLSLVLYLLGFLTVACRARISTKVHKHPNAANKCLVDGITLEVNKEAPIAPCGKMVCGNNGLVTFHKCDNENDTGNNLSLVNPKESYPNCCKRQQAGA